MSRYTIILCCLALATAGCEKLSAPIPPSLKATKKEPELFNKICVVQKIINIPAYSLSDENGSFHYEAVNGIVFYCSDEIFCVTDDKLIKDLSVDDNVIVTYRKATKTIYNSNKQVASEQTYNIFVDAKKVDCK
jgi:hypothetical protein